MPGDKGGERIKPADVEEFYDQQAENDWRIGHNVNRIMSTVGRNGLRLGAAGDVFLEEDERNGADKADDHYDDTGIGLFQRFGTQKTAEAVIHDENAGAGNKSRLD